MTDHWRATALRLVPTSGTVASLPAKSFAFSARDWALLAAIAVAAVLIALIDPVGYIGGRWDDGRYLEAALRWNASGPNLGVNHWALRWPIVLPAVAAIHAFGLTNTALMLPGLAAFAALLALTFAGVRIVTGDRLSAMLASLSIATTLAPTAAATRLTADLPEALFWAMALWSLVAATRSNGGTQARWLLATGLGCGLAWAVRETALGLGIVMLAAGIACHALRSWRLGWIIVGALLVIVPEQLVLWRASGDFFYRLVTDLHHIDIPSTHLAGGVATGVFAPLNPELASRWDGAGPIRLVWAIDPWLNLFINSQYGLNFLAAALLAPLAWPTLKRHERQALRWIAVVIAANIVTVIYIVATDPQPRMFMPAIVAAATALGPLLVITWRRRSRWPVAALATAKLLMFTAALMLASRYTAMPSLADRVLASTSSPVAADRWTLSHLALAPAELKARLHQQPLAGACLLLTVEKAGTMSDMPPGQWRMVRQAALASPIIDAARRFIPTLSSNDPQLTLWRLQAAGCTSP